LTFVGIPPGLCAQASIFDAGGEAGATIAGMALVQLASPLISAGSPRPVTVEEEDPRGLAHEALATEISGTSPLWLGGEDCVLGALTCTSPFEQRQEAEAMVDGGLGAGGAACEATLVVPGFVLVTMGMVVLLRRAGCRRA
jgi:hypothetical protein